MSMIRRFVTRVNWSGMDSLLVIALALMALVLGILIVSDVVSSWWLW